MGEDVVNELGDVMDAQTGILTLEQVVDGSGDVVDGVGLIILGQVSDDLQLAR